MSFKFFFKILLLSIERFFKSNLYFLFEVTFFFLKVNNDKKIFFKIYFCS